MSAHEYWTRLQEHAAFWSGTILFTQHNGGVDLDPHTLWGFLPVAGGR